MVNGQQKIVKRVWGLCWLLVAVAVSTVPAWAQTSVTKREAARKQLEKAVGLLQQQEDSDKVLAALRDVVAVDPNWADGRAAYGHALYARSDFAGADVQLTWAVTLDPANASHKHALGVTKLMLGQSSQAVGFLAEANRLEPENPEFRYGLLLGYIQVGRWDRAIELWNTGALKAADTPEKIAVTIILKAIQDQEEEALAMAVAANRKYPENPVFAFLVGLIFEGEARQEDAIRAYEEAIKQYPDNYDLHRILVTLYLEAGYYRKAEHMIKTYLSRPSLREVAPIEDKVQGIFAIANAQYQTGNYRGSERSYSQYRALFGKYKKQMGRVSEPSTLGIDALAHFANGVIEERKGQYPQAISEYELAIKGDPAFLLAYERLGQSYLLRAELIDLKERPPLLRQAKGILEQALELKRDNPAVYQILGNATYQLALLEQGQFRQGLLREALFLFGQADIGLRDKYAVRVFQAKISDTLGEYRQALKYYQDAARIRSKVPEVHMLAGHSNIKLWQYPDAVSAFTKAAKVGGDQQDAALGIALAYERMGNSELADQWYDNAAQSSKGRKWLSQAEIEQQQTDDVAEQEAIMAEEPESDANATSEASPQESPNESSEESPGAELPEEIETQPAAEEEQEG